MKNIRGILSYEGTRYLGWQKTRMGPSVEEEVEKALSVILRTPVRLQAASRTDAGVHAKGQVINFIINGDTDLTRLKRGVNALLPYDIQLHALEEADLAFHPTLDAKKKEYIYEICTGAVQSPFFHELSWHFPHRLDLTKMQLAAEALLGTHDFSAFCNAQNPDPHCTIDSINIYDLGGGRIRIVIQGNRFLYKMMRNLAGTIAYVGCNKLKPVAVRDILASRDRKCAGVTAPAHGLYLQRVFYDIP